MEFTGERVMIGGMKPFMMKEHLERYYFARDFVKNKKVLDIACGTGYGSEILRSDAKKIIGGDISMETIKFAEKNYPNKKIKFLQIDATKMNLKSNSFDLVVSFETIEHFKDFKKYLKEVKRVLKKRGLFICSTPNKNLSSPFTKKPSNPFHTQEFSLKNFINLIGFHFENTVYYGQLPVKNNLFFKLKSIIMTFTPYYSLLPFMKKFIKYRPSERKIPKDYAKVLSLKRFQKGVEPKYLICVAKNLKK